MSNMEVEKEEKKKWDEKLHMLGGIELEYQRHARELYSRGVE